jgi:hypothetical protein
VRRRRLLRRQGGGATRTTVWVPGAELGGVAAAADGGPPGLGAQAGLAEEIEERLLGPLPGRRGLLHVEDRVALREVLHRARQHRAEGLEHALAAHGDRRDHVGSPRVERAVEGFDLEHLGQVALVVLEHERHLLHVEPVLEQVLRHLAEALDVLFPAVERRVGHEHERVGALQHELARGRVHRLAGNRQHLQPQVEAAKAGVRSGSRSNRIVRSCAELIEIRSPRRLAAAARCRICRFVVFPPTGGP